MPAIGNDDGLEMLVLSDAEAVGTTGAVVRFGAILLAATAVEQVIERFVVPLYRALRHTKLTLREAGERYIAHLETRRGLKRATPQDYVIYLRRHLAGPQDQEVRRGTRTPTHPPFFEGKSLQTEFAMHDVQRRARRSRLRRRRRDGPSPITGSSSRPTTTPNARCAGRSSTASSALAASPMRIERLLSFHTTCRLQRRPLHDDLIDAFTAHSAATLCRPWHDLLGDWTLEHVRPKPLNTCCGVRGRRKSSSASPWNTWRAPGSLSCGHAVPSASMI